MLARSFSKDKLTGMSFSLRQTNIIPSIALSAHRLACLLLGLTFFLAPVRLRWTILSRPYPPVYKDYTDFLFFAADGALLAAVCAWLLQRALQPARRLQTGPLFLTLPAVGLLLSALASIPRSADPPLSLYHTIRLCLLFLVYLLIVNDRPRPGLMLGFAAAGLVLQAWVAAAQYLVQRSLGMVSLGELALDPAWKGVSIVWAEGIRSLRAYGLSDHPNILAGCLAFTLVWLLGWNVFHQEHGTTFASLPRLASLAVFLLGLLALLLTFSRTGWLAFLVGGLVLAGLAKPVAVSSPGAPAAQHVLLRLAGLAVASLLILTPFLWVNKDYLAARSDVLSPQVEQGNEFRSINERRLLNTSAAQMFSQRPLTGVGLGAFPSALRQQDPSFLIDYQPAHNTLLAAAADTGLFGALFFALMTFLPFTALLTKTRRTALRLSPQLAALSAVFAAVAAVGLFDYYTWLLVPGRIWYWFTLGLWASVYLSLGEGTP